MSAVKAKLARHHHRDTPTPKSWVSGGHACTHSPFHTALPGWARPACAHPLPLPWAHCLPYTSSQLNGAWGCFTVLRTGPAESHSECEVLLGALLPPCWPCSPPALWALPSFSGILHRRENDWGRGGGHFLSLEAVESGHADHPMPYKSLFPMVPTATAPGGHQREMGGTGDVVWSSDQCGSGVWPLWSIPGARGPPRGRNSRL